jgi:two-component system, chemotaxis family, CheB/CheR fusion protein
VNLQLTQKTILIVDDDTISLFLFKELIEPTGAKIFTVYDGRSAIEIVKKQPVDLILLDLKLTDYNGYNLLVKIRELKPDAFIIAQTAYAMIEDCQKCLEAGFDDYLSKPIISVELFSKLKKYLT